MRCVLLIVFTASCVSSITAAEKRPPVQVTDEALQIHRQALVIDGHIDLPWKLRTEGDFSLKKFDLTQIQKKLETDLPRLRKGGMGGVFWSAYVPADTNAGEALLQTLEQIDLIHRLVQRYPNDFELALTADDIQRIHRAGKIASLIGIEGGHSIQNSLGVLRKLHSLGARYMTLTHSNTIEWADSATDKPQHGGLTPFGEEVVREMNRLGMLVDISHVSPETMDDALRVSRAPVIASHSSAYAIAPHPRNVPDDILKRIAANQGVVMVNFYSGFVLPSAAETARQMFAARREYTKQLKNQDEVNAAMNRWHKEHPIDAGTIHDVVDHIDHIVKVAGIDCVGLGSDFDGVSKLPAQLEDVSTYPYITQELLNRKYTAEQIHKIMGLNLLRVMRAAERVAREKLAAAPSGSPAVPANKSTQTAHPVTEGRKGMVVSVSPDASDAGLSILQQGGNAADAAIATAFALAVTFPEAGNIGGGGFMMIYPSSKQPKKLAGPLCIDYRETAPAAATKDMFANDSRQTGHKVVGVPGTVRGLALGHAYGKLPWKDLLQPAIRLAAEGFTVDEVLAADLNRLLKDKDSSPEFRRVFSKPKSNETTEETTWRAGDRLIQPDLARTLQRIADEGPDAFYRGEIANQLVAEMQAGGGLITHDDLQGYKAQARVPVHGTYRGYDIYSSPPPSSGGTCIVEMLNILEHFNLRQYDRYSSRTLHLMTEAMRRAYCDRARYLGDPDFVKIPDHLTSKEYASKLAKDIDLNRATKSESLAPEIELAAEGPSTTHFSVVDADGMAVSNTYTLQNSYGSRVVVRGAGFLLNNEMTDFNPRPGHTDRAGKIGTPANQIVPGKRMLSSQSPTIVARDGKLVLVTGSPGGRTIPNTVLNILVNVLEYEMDPRSAVDAPRTHHQWFPDRLSFEGVKQNRHTEAVEQLSKMGHNLDPRGVKQGDGHSILIRDDTYFGAADYRRTKGKAAGY